MLHESDLLLTFYITDSKPTIVINQLIYYFVDDNEKIEPRKKPPMASLSPYREQGRANLQKLQKLNQISRIPVLSNTKKINRTTKFKKIHAAVQHLVDLQTMQNLERFSRKKSIPSIEIKRDTDLVVELPELDWKNEQVVKSTVEKLQLKSLELQKDNSEYQQQILVLQRRISKEQEKGKGFIIPKVTTTVPTSLEANIHLRFQYQKNLENERKKYTGLVLENERLLLTIKELSMKNYKNKKALSIEEQTQHSNEVSLLKAKIRELILDNQQLTEIVVKREQTIEKLAKEKEYIYGEMMTMRRLQMHLSNRLENDDSSNIPTMTPAIAEPINSESAESNSNQEKKVIPHYAETLKRNTEVKLRDNNARQISIQEQTLSKKKKIDPATKARLYEPKKPNKKSQEPNSVKQQEKLDTVPRIMPERNIQSASHQRAKTISTDSITDKPSGDTNRTRSTSEQAAMNAAKIKMEYDAYVQPKKLES
ncbi:hypothetical protein BC833DRAFT_582006 [Globomyces pollinis-pini]|nr:hypothetical protein BC833DRAFT_582006 [Globomyces pollinis-pini]